MTSNDKKYEQREQEEFIRQRNAPTLLPRNEFRQTAAEFAAAMAAEPQLIAERISWLLNGSYGRGSYENARKVAANTRMNREAWMVQIIGAIEWQCREVDTRKAFNALTPEQKAKLNGLVLAEIAYHLTERDDQEGAQA